MTSLQVIALLLVMCISGLLGLVAAVLCEILLKFVVNYFLTWWERRKVMTVHERAKYGEIPCFQAFRVGDEILYPGDPRWEILERQIRFQSMGKLTGVDE